MKNIKEIREELEDCVYESKQDRTDAEKTRIRVYALRSILMSVDLEMAYHENRGEIRNIDFFDDEDSEEI